MSTTTTTAPLAPRVRPNPNCPPEWILGCQTDFLRQLPGRVTPFIAGPVLRDHLRPLAEAFCPPVLLKRWGDNYYAALVSHWIETGEEQTMVCVGDKTETFYLWVQIIVPCYNGKRPPPAHEIISSKRWKCFKRFLRGKGLSEEFLSDIEVGSAPYPPGVAFPAWIPPKLEKIVKKHMAQHAAKVNATAVHEAVVGQNGGLGSEPMKS